ncbi:B- and T-lymphocyte attenuator-like [Salvelinus sp. IW2-2015]|uniref:B- and T-lymphocyte attenuator-like n=1 Tax=Salvelinus sp. IW2-2015 TaxID=2691554 RepID=UPI0038D3F7A0
MTSSETRLHSGRGQDFDCFPEIRVARYTVWRASPGEQLKINCSVDLCSNSPPPSLWCKVESNNCNTVNTTALIQTQWTNLTNTTGISFLTFKNISRGDAGLYRCELHKAVGHSINVIVSERVKDTTDVYQNNETTNSTVSQRDSFLEWVWPYVYSSAGIVVFVIVVITISMLSMRGCKGACPSRRSRKEDQTENQFKQTYTLHISLSFSPVLVLLVQILNGL